MGLQAAPVIGFEWRNSSREPINQQNGAECWTATVIGFEWRNSYREPIRVKSWHVF